MVFARGLAIMLDVPDSVADKEVLSADSDEKDVQEPIDYENDEQFYVKAQKYWSGVDATINGMLGGKIYTIR